MDLRSRPRRAPTAPEFPRHIDIDLSTKCNLRCRFCHLSYYTPKSWTQISVDQFSAIEPLLPHLKSITMFSKYEVLTCRDFIKIFDLISAFDIETYFSTNGILLRDEVIEAIVGKLTYLTVSVTGFTRETYEQNMGQDRLETVKANLTRLNEAKARLGTDLPRLRISTVGMLDTLDQLIPAVDFAHEFSATEGVQLTHLKAHGTELVPLMPLKNPKRFQLAADAAHAHATKLGLPFDQQGGTIQQNQKDTAELGHRYCTLPWTRMSIQPDGDVYPCPLSTVTVGNIFKESADEIWNGEALESFRRGVNDPANANEDCRNCTHCRHRSVLDPAANDFSEKQEYVAGMTRK